MGEGDKEAKEEIRERKGAALVPPEARCVGCRDLQYKSARRVGMVNKKCEHGRQRHNCKDCGGGGLCEHGRRRTLCKDCGSGSICEHGHAAALQVQGVRRRRSRTLCHTAVPGHCRGRVALRLYLRKAK